MVEKKGCAERIAPIGTLSQNGYGEEEEVYLGPDLMTNANPSRKNKAFKT